MLAAMRAPVAVSLCLAVGCGRARAPATVTSTAAPETAARTGAGWDAACPGGASFHIRGLRDAVATFCARPDGVRDGRFTLFWSDGAIAVDGRYDGGARAGTWTAWNPTFGHEAAPLATIEYRDGAPVDAEAAAQAWWIDDEACPDDGALSRSLYDGQTFLSCKVDDVAHGPAAEFHANGRRQAVGAYHEDEQHGHWIVWREEDGTRFGEAFFDRGVDVGRWQYWDSSGALIRTEVYQDGELVETIEP